MTAPGPLIVALDGVLLRTHSYWEVFWSAAANDPAATWRAVWRNRGAARAAALSQIAPPDPATLPVNRRVLELATASQQRGRTVGLVSATDHAVVARVAAHYGIEGPIYASDGKTWMGRRARAEALKRDFGAGGYDYVGGLGADRGALEGAENAIILGRWGEVENALVADGRNVTTLPLITRRRALIRALRPQGLLKVLLLVLPLIAAPAFDWANLANVILAMAAFGAAGAAGYLVNDLADLGDDRAHPIARAGQIACGAVSIVAAMVLALVAAVLALGLAALSGAGTLVMVLVFLGLSLAYSLRFKRMRWVDIALLSSLGLARVVAGAVAAGIAVSGWLVAIMCPVLLALACARRLAEIALEKPGLATGGGFRRADRRDLLNVAILCAVIAVITLLAFAASTEAGEIFAQRWPVWFAALPLAGWLRRVIAAGWDGRHGHDPLIFGMTDRMSLALLATVLGLVVAAYGF